MPAPDILASLGIDPLIADEAFGRADNGLLVDRADARVVLVAAETARSFRHVLEAAEPGAWSVAMKLCGTRCGAKIATSLDEALAALGHPTLTSLPLEACLALLEHSIAASGWGRIRIDLNDAADYGFVVARLEHSFNAAALTDADGFVDSMLAGVLQGFFAHISGQNIECVEIACARHGSAECTFVIAAPDRLAALAPEIGRASVETLLTRLRQ